MWYLSYDVYSFLIIFLVFYINLKFVTNFLFFKNLLLSFLVKIILTLLSIYSIYLSCIFYCFYCQYVCFILRHFVLMNMILHFQDLNCSSSVVCGFFSFYFQNFRAQILADERVWTSITSFWEYLRFINVSPVNLCFTITIDSYQLGFTFSCFSIQELFCIENFLQFLGLRNIIIIW